MKALYPGIAAACSVDPGTNGPKALFCSLASFIRGEIASHNARSASSTKSCCSGIVVAGDEETTDGAAGEVGFRSRETTSAAPPSSTATTANARATLDARLPGGAPNAPDGTIVGLA